MEKCKQPKVHCINKLGEGPDKLTEWGSITIFRNFWLFLHVLAMLFLHVLAMLFLQVLASVISQLVNNLTSMQEKLVQFLGWEDTLEKG